jgi:RsiW-degrading membrane proteinase PrsW (M82 family)
MSFRPIVLALVGLLVVSGVLGVVADRWTRAHRSPDARASELSRAGNFDGAERMYWSLLEEGPVTMPLLMSFLQAHEAAVESFPVVFDDKHTAKSSEGIARRLDKPAPIDESAIDAFLARSDLPPGIGLLGRYWRGVVGDVVDPAVEAEVVSAANAEPPMPWANHLLGHDALERRRLEVAAERLVREGSHFPERASDTNVAIEIWTHEEAWGRIDQALADPSVAAAVRPWYRLLWALRVHDWKGAGRAFPGCLRSPMTVGSATLAAVAALAWGIFCARLGGALARPRFRIPLYLTSFALGVASVSLTLAFVALEEVFLKMHETGEWRRDFLFFTFGVGFREEVSKLVFFAPLLPVLHRRGTRLDVLICGALVGLGFAAEENLGYLEGGDLSTAMARFLTANFFHMSMTAILAGALDDLLRRDRRPHRSRRDPEDDGSFRFSIALLTVAALHGVYDFFLSSRAFGDVSFVAMFVFLILARLFLSLVSVARAKERAARPRLLQTFTLGMTVVIGASFVYASALVGPAAAAASLAEGMLGLGIIMIMFIQELRRV